MNIYPKILLVVFVLVFCTAACQSSQISTILASSPNDPVFISGKIKYTSPFFVNSLAEPFVMLEDEAGFVKRNREFIFTLASQTIGPVEKTGDGVLTYYLSLPKIPQGTLVDLDNNSTKDKGVQVFAIAYWSNTWGGPFLEERDGTGWSTAYTSTITDPEKKNEITGGTLIVWAPDDKQSFPTDFGADGMLFTKDDPIAIIPAGYNLIDLNQKPFHVYKELEPKIDLNEGEGAVKDFSKMQYGEAFDTMFKRASVEYPFTTEKKIDWEALFAKYSPQAAKAKGDNEFYQIIHDLTLEFPDGHVGGPFNAKVFYRECGGGFGMLLTELSDKRVIVSKIFPSGPAAEVNIQEGMEIISWNDQPIGDAISQVIPYFGIGSTEHTKRLAQILFLTRVAPDMQVKIKYKNLQSKENEATLKAISEYDSLQFALYGEGSGTVSLPIEAKMLGDSGMAYININTFSDDDNLEARLWDRHIKKMTDEKIPGLILDLRRNGGGNLGLAMSFAGYFFDKEITLYQRSYYNENTKSFEVESIPTRIKPAPILYSGKIAVLVSPDCVSACEGFAYAMAQNGRAKIIGHYPTAGAFGEVGRGQYKLPGDINLQFPTGKPESMDGNLIIENTGVIPDIFVPITRESALDKQDALLETAVKEVSQ